MRSRSTDSKSESESDESARSSDSLSTATARTGKVSTAAENARTGKLSTAGVERRKTTASRSRSSRGPSHDYDSDVIPGDIHLRNKRSVHRSTVNAYHDGLDEDDAQVPESVRKVISSAGRSLDTSVQRTMESRMGEDFSEVQIHTGPRAAKATEDINAKAFTVGNHVAFNRGEYDPSSAEGQRVIAHELTHVRQQTGGAVSMLPQDDIELEIDPDPELEQAAEETAQRVMQGEQVGIQRLAETDVHVQRSPHGTPGAGTSAGDVELGIPPLALAEEKRNKEIEEALDKEEQEVLQSLVEDIKREFEEEINSAAATGGTTGGAPPGHVPAAPATTGGTTGGAPPGHVSAAPATTGGTTGGAPEPSRPASGERDIHWSRWIGDGANGWDTALATNALINQADPDGNFFQSQIGAAPFILETLGLSGLLKAAECPYCRHRNNTFLNGGAMGTFLGTIFGEALRGKGIWKNGTHLLSKVGGYAGAFSVNQAQSWHEDAPWRDQIKNVYHTECSHCENRYHMYKAAFDTDYQRECQRIYSETKSANPDRRDFPELSGNTITPERRKRKENIEKWTSQLGNLSTGAMQGLGLADAYSMSHHSATGYVRPNQDNNGNNFNAAGAVGTVIGAVVGGNPLIYSITCPNPDCQYVNRDFIYSGQFGAALGGSVSEGTGDINGRQPVRLAATAGGGIVPAIYHVGKRAWNRQNPYKCTCGRCRTEWNVPLRYAQWYGESFQTADRTIGSPGQKLYQGGKNTVMDWRDRFNAWKNGTGEHTDGDIEAPPERGHSDGGVEIEYARGHPVSGASSAPVLPPRANSELGHQRDRLDLTTARATIAGLREEQERARRADIERARIAEIERAARAEIERAARAESDLAKRHTQQRRKSL